MNRNKYKSGFTPHAVVILIGTLILGSVGTVAAANNAKPGDILYPIDRGVENLRINLATSSESEVELHTQFASERITEVQQLLQDKGVDLQGLGVAISNLTFHKASVAKLIAQEAELEARAKALDDLFDQKEEELEATLNEAKRGLKKQKATLKAQLAQAISDGDTAKAGSLRTKIAEIEAQLDALEAQEEAAEEALEAEEEKLEGQLEAEEKALEEQERMEEEQEEEQERLEETQEELEDEDNEKDQEENED